MGHYLHIFVNSIEPVSSLIAFIGEVMGEEMKAVEGDDLIIYQIAVANCYASLGRHRFVNDGNLLFENYSYQIKIRTYGFREWQDCERKMFECADHLYAALRR